MELNKHDICCVAVNQPIAKQKINLLLDLELNNSSNPRNLYSVLTKRKSKLLQEELMFRFVCTQLGAIFKQKFSRLFIMRRDSPDPGMTLPKLANKSVGPRLPRVSTWPT